MKNKKRILKCLIVVGGLVLICWVAWACWFACMYFGLPSKKYETYVVDINRDRGSVTATDVIDYLYVFQCSHPECRVMGVDSAGNEYHNFSPDSDKLATAKERMVCFYLQSIDMPVSCTVEVTPRNHPIIKLYYVNEGPYVLKYVDTKNSNKIARKKNRELKKKFETEILDNLGVKWRNKRFWD